MISVESAHEAYHAAAGLLQKSGSSVESVRDARSVGSGFGTRQRPSLEVLASSFRICDPRNRILPVGCAGFHLGYAAANFLWTVEGTGDPAFILEYNSRGQAFLDGGIFACAVPYRLMRHGGVNALDAAVRLLEEDPSTRRAYIPLISPHDIEDLPLDYPCIASVQFFIRAKRLCAITSMRSQSLAIMPYDMFVFTMLQEMVANILGLDLGDYFHLCNSLHLYPGDFGRPAPDSECAVVVTSMEPMPRSPDLTAVLAAERDLRHGQLVSEAQPGGDFWSPLFDAMAVTLEFNRRRP